MDRDDFTVFLVVQLSAPLPDFSVVDPNAFLATLFWNTLNLLIWETMCTTHTEQCAAILMLCVLTITVDKGTRGEHSLTYLCVNTFSMYRRRCHISHHSYMKGGPR